MAQSSLEGESFCYSFCSYPSTALSKGESVVLLVVWCSGAVVQAAVGLKHACIKQWFPTQCTHSLSDFHKLSMLRISSESCSAFEEQVGKVPLSAEWKSHLWVRKKTGITFSPFLHCFGRGPKLQNKPRISGNIQSAACSQLILLQGASSWLIHEQ